MKFTPEVIAAIQTLRDNAENDFERHRIDVLERELTAPPQVEQIDDKHQRFNGVSYTRDSKGYYRATLHIQRAIWNYYRGEIPNDYQIHHIDEDPSNNTLENTICISRSEHQKIHKCLGIPAAQRTKNPNIICAHCGKQFQHSSSHKKYCSEQCRLAHDTVCKVCPVCGKTFTVPKKHKYQVFCSRHCFMIKRCAKS